MKEKECMFTCMAVYTVNTERVNREHGKHGKGKGGPFLLPIPHLVFSTLTSTIPGIGMVGGRVIKRLGRHLVENQAIRLRVRTFGRYFPRTGGHPIADGADVHTQGKSKVYLRFTLSYFLLKHQAIIHARSISAVYPVFRVPQLSDSSNQGGAIITGLLKRHLRQRPCRISFPRCIFSIRMLMNVHLGLIVLSMPSKNDGKRRCFASKCHGPSEHIIINSCLLFPVDGRT